MRQDGETGKEGDAAKADRLPGDGVPFARIRRITGYLVGTLERWNNAKRAEERERVKHGSGESAERGSGVGHGE